MQPERLLFDKVSLYSGDCLEVMAGMEPNSMDSCATDPPYHLTSIVKRFGNASESDDTKTSERVRNRVDGYARLTAGGFMGQTWDGGDIAFRLETWMAVYRVLKPGAHLVAFGGTRNYHRMACAIEDAGFEIRDSLMWLYGTGFPKSHDVSKGIDKQAGAVREILERREVAVGFDREGQGGGGWSAGEVVISAPATDAAREWQGWGTALKPGFEPIVLARKPLAEKTVAANVLQWRTGAINIDGCRIAAAEGDSNARVYSALRTAPGATQNATGERHLKDVEYQGVSKEGRWPANVVHDGSAEVVELFPQGTKGHEPRNVGTFRKNHIFGEDNAPRLYHPGFEDEGSAARFFYSAKANKRDRAGSKHPTVKPVSLLQWLVRLITPPGGTVLDPFAGTGTTGEAAWRECFKAALIEAEPTYQDDIRRRMKLAAMGPEERARYDIGGREPEMYPLSEAA